ncbi:MAG TPA: transposase [Candidatus Acidoferrales bacterium]|nr:transposase [Candidatus Acidoferrales bacterium]
MPDPAVRCFPHKNIRLHSLRYVGRASHFITICCEERRPLLKNAARAIGLIEILQGKSTAHRFSVHAYCVMPDHIHMLVSGLEDRSDLLAFVKDFKREAQWQFPPEKKRKAPTEKRAQTPRATVAATKPAVWQKKFYDHILRQTDKMNAVAGYIWTNPVRAGLCVDPREYPYSGSLVTDWKNIIRPLESWVPQWKKSPMRTNEQTEHARQEPPKNPARR